MSRRGLELLQQVPPSETLGSTLDCRTSVNADARSLRLALDCSFSSSSSFFVFLGFSLQLLDRSVGYIRSSPTGNSTSVVLLWRLWLGPAVLDLVSTPCSSSAGGWTLQSDRLGKAPPCRATLLLLGGEDAAASRRTLSRLASI